MSLTKGEYSRIDRKLEDNERKLLLLLAEIHEKDPKNPWVTKERLETFVGGITKYLNLTSAMFKLYTEHLIEDEPHHRNNVAITAIGLDYVKMYKEHLAIPRERIGKIFWLFIILFILLGTFLAIITCNFLMLIIPIVGGLIVWGVQVIYNRYLRSN